MSEAFCEVGNGIDLCYETFGTAGHPPALLIMGLGTQMIAWQDDFCTALAQRGMYVIRFDNRDAGRSTHLPGRPPSLMDLLLRRRSAARYTLVEMARDAVGLLEKLDLGPAHVIGASMGGMIAQTIAARHPHWARSLVTIMSNTGSRRSGQPALGVYPLFLTRPARDREAFVEHAVKLFAAIGSSGLPQDLEDIPRLAALSYDRDRDAGGAGRQLGAIIASGDRTDELHAITAPTLVVHGTADRLVRPSGGRATARAIPQARLLTFQGMGHDLPRAIWSRLIDAILENAARADPRPAHP